MSEDIRPPHCHGQCINAPVGEPPNQQTFNMLCVGCRTRREGREEDETPRSKTNNHSQAQRSWADFLKEPS